MYTLYNNYTQGVRSLSLVSYCEENVESKGISFDWSQSVDMEMWIPEIKHVLKRNIAQNLRRGFNVGSNAPNINMPEHTRVRAIRDQRLGVAMGIRIGFEPHVPRTAKPNGSVLVL